MKKILIVYDTMMTGGTTTALLSLLNEFDYNSYSVDLLLFEMTGPFLNYIPKQVKILKPAYNKQKKVLPVSKEKILRTVLNGNAIRAVFTFWKYRGTVKGNFRNILMCYGIKSQVSMSRYIKDEYDVAIGFIEGWADQYVLSDKVKAESKIVWIHPDYKASYLISEIDKVLLKNATKVVVVSEKCKMNFSDVFPEYSNKVILIENITSSAYINMRASENTPSIKKAWMNFCTVARCDMQVKGLDRVLISLKKLKEQGYTGFIWHYIGTGKDIQQVEHLAQEYGLIDNVICYGEMNNPLVILKQMDYFILASRYEGKPVSVTEAMALKIPCIVTEYASAHEQVLNGVNGIVTENSVEGVYGALKSVLDCYNLRDKYCSNIRDISNLNEILKLYTII